LSKNDFKDDFKDIQFKIFRDDLTTTQQKMVCPQPWSPDFSGPGHDGPLRIDSSASRKKRGGNWFSTAWKMGVVPGLAI
jgi:hypothetical protein